MKKILLGIFIFLFNGVIMNTNSQTLKVNYKRLENDYENWRLWVWNKTDSRPGFDIYPSTISDFWLVFLIDLEKNNLYGKEIGLLPKYKEWENKEPFDRIFKHNDEKEVFIIEGDTNVYRSLKEIEISTQVIAAYYDDNNLIRITLNRRVLPSFISENFYLIDTQTGDKKEIQKINDEKSKKYILLKTQELNLEDIRNGRYIISSIYGDKYLDFGKIIYKVPATEKELGEIIENDKITLRVFSLAKELYLIIKKDEKEQEFKMNCIGNFIWEITLSTSFLNSLYRYKAVYPDKTLYGIDPYAKLTVMNNTWALLKKDETKVSDGPSFDISETVIYEMSIRDFTIDEFSGVKNKGKFLGLSEENTNHPNYPDIKTAISHLKELGINAVHIMPFYDFEKDENLDDYDWGYMPVSFNSPDGWFSINKYEKISEAKKMIDTFHKNNIKVIMDVVYNHTAETGDKVYNFNALAPNYFYRTNDDGTYSNGSGCGNEFKSESPYGRKFIIDSLKYWVSEYKIDGFRFDLMGLIDLETADMIVSELKKIKPDIIIYGEPWTGGPTPIQGVKKGTQKGKGYSVFNDDFRDAIKGSVFNLEDLGYVQAGNYRDKVIKGIKGSFELFTNSPLETINYVSCHDNHTLFDRIKYSLKNETFQNIVKMDRLAQGIIFVSQGIPFLHSGEEILRTKFGNENSYNAGDEINKIRWTDKKNYYYTFTYYRDLIKLRKQHPAFRMKTKNEIEKNIKFYEDLNIPLPDKKSIAFIINGKNVGDRWKEILVIINPNKEKKDFVLPEGTWINVFDENGFASTNEEYSSKFRANPISLSILVKN